MASTYSAVTTLEDDDTATAMDQIEALQSIINSGMAWKLQGSYGRAAMDAIASGHCTLGPTGHRDYWGNYIPSVNEVQEGTKGSREYVAAHAEICECF